MPSRETTITAPSCSGADHAAAVGKEKLPLVSLKRDCGRAVQSGCDRLMVQGEGHGIEEIQPMALFPSPVLGEIDPKCRVPAGHGEC